VVRRGHPALARLSPHNATEWAAERAATPYPAGWERDDEDWLHVRHCRSKVGRETTARARPWSTASLKSVQPFLRSFCCWLQATDLLQKDLLAGAGSPRLSQTLKETFSAHEWVA
jgi:hypothetical protein